MTVVTELVAKLSIEGLREAASQLSGFSERMDGTSDKLKKWGAGLSVGVTAPLVLLGKQAISAASDYEGSMNLLQATSGATASQMGVLGQTATALGQDLTLPATSAVDASEAMLELVKAGMSINDTLAASKGVLQMSAAGELGNAEAATIAANALNAFHLEGTEAVRVADLLAAASNASSAEVRDIAASMQMSSAVAYSAGQSIGDMTTAIGMMANAGIVGSDAGTSLKTMLMSLMNPSDDAYAAMQNLGISVYDAAGNMRPMAAIIDQFSGAMKGLTQEEQNIKLGTIFGSDAIRAANIVLTAGKDNFDAMSEAVNKQGAAGELAAARMKGLGGAFEGLKSVIESTLMSAMLPLMGTLEGIVRAVSGVVSKFSALDPKLQKAIIIFGAVAAAVGPLLAVFGLMLPAIGAIGAALGVLLSPIGLVVAAIALLAAAWATNFGGIQDKTAVVMGYLKGVIESVLGGILAFWQANGEQIMAVVTFVWDQVKVIFEGAFTVLSSIFAAFKAAFSGDWEGFGRNLRVAWDTIWKTILTVLRNIIPIIRTAITDLAKAIIQNFKDTNWKELGLAILDGIVKVLAGAKDVIVGVIKGLLGGAMGAVKGFFGIGGGNESGAGASPAGGSRQPLGPAMGGGLAMPGMSGGANYAAQGQTAGQQWAAAYAQAVQEHISGMGDAIAASLQPPVDYRYRRQAVGVRALA